MKSDDLLLLVCFVVIAAGIIFIATASARTVPQPVLPICVVIQTATPEIR